MKSNPLFNYFVAWLAGVGLAFGAAPATQLATLISADHDHCQVVVELPDAGLKTLDTSEGTFHQISQEGMFPVSQTGEPALQALAWTLEIPATSGIQWELQYETTLYEHVNLLPELIDANGAEDVQSDLLWEDDSFFPAEIVTVSDPVIMRNHRLVQVALTPYQYNPVSRQLLVYHDVEISFSFAGENPVNQIDRELPRAAVFEQMLAVNVLNYEVMNPADRLYDENLGLGPVLYIYNSSAQSYLEPLLDWKREKGQVVYTATQSQVTLTSSTSINNYINNAYNNWDNPPVFVTLVGDPSSCSFGTVAASNSTGDHVYAQQEGGDILGDVIVGRMSVNKVGQLDVVVGKQLSYEKAPYMTQSSWLSSAHLIGDDSISGMSMVYTSENIRHKLMQDGVGNVSTCYYYQGCSNVPNSIINAFNDGILYFNYRGWWGMSDWEYHSASELSNDEMLPFVVTITCDTGTFVGGTSISEDFYIAGSTSLYKGGVASIGTATLGTHTRYNNAVDLGVFGGIFDHGMFTAGESLFQGKFELWQAYWTVASGNVTNFSYWNNLIGDASLELRTKNPRSMVITHDATLTGGASSFPVQVYKDGAPLAGALVCLYQSGTQVKLLTDANGDAVLPLEGQYTSGTAVLTVTKRDLYPYSTNVSITSQSLYVDVDGGTLDDDNSGGSSGNNDGQLNPDETIELTLDLTNLGTSSTATSVNATISCSDPRVTITQDYSTFPNISPGATVGSNSLYNFSVAAVVDVDQPQTVQLDVAVSTSGGDFDGTLLVDLIEPVLAVQLLETDPAGDDHISQGETGELFFELRNWGNVVTGSLTATLTSSDPQVTIVDGSASFGSIPIGGTGQNSSAFLLRPDGNIFNGHPVPVSLTLTNGDGVIMTVESEFNVGPLGQDDPIGPVDGYYCFDSGDINYTRHPTYSWVEISSTGTVIPLTDNGNENDDSYVLSLPFNFMYHGISYNQVTVCSNGWLAFGSQGSQVNYRNFPIPTSIGPSAMVAPFWDDLRVNTSGTTRRVYYYNDSVNHRYIIEWYQVLQVGPGSPLETFEVILYDQDYLPTTNGDILFQYNNITNNTNSSSTDNNYATVGIESPGQTTGIQYSYWNTYPDGALPLQNGLAILFTEDPGSFGFDDTYPPVITHTNQAVQEGSGPYTLDADIVDASGVETASLFWSLNGVDFTEDVMTQVVGDTWAGEVPSQPLGTTVWYYFWARDNSDNHNEATSATYTFINGNWEVYFTHDVESGEEGWTHSAAGGWSDQWHISTEDSYSPTHSWKCGDTGAGTYIDQLDARLVTPTITINPSSQMSFQHRIQAEVSGVYPDSAYDGGIVEISDNGGGSWVQLIPTTGYNKAFRGYSGGVPCTHPFAGSTPCYSGEFGWQEAQVDLDAWSGSDVLIRFRFGSDQATGMEGWYVDDITISGLTFVEPEPLVIQITYNEPYITVSWDAVPQAVTYRVYQSSDPYGGFTLAQESAMTTYTAIAGSTPLFYKVTWIN